MSLKSFKRYINEKYLNNPPKKKIKILKNDENALSVNINNLICNSSNSIVKKTNIDDFIIKLIIFKKLQSVNKYHNYYIYLIYSYIKEKRKPYLIEEELNGLDYEYYRNIDDRKWYDIFLSLFKTNYDFTNTFFLYNNSNNYKIYDLYTIKIMIYINSLSYSIIINLMFYTDETMHKIYSDNGEYNLLYRFPILILSDLIMKLISILLGKLINYQNELIKIKICLNFTLDNKETNLKDKIKDNSKTRIINNTSNEKINTEGANKNNILQNLNNRKISNKRKDIIPILKDNILIEKERNDQNKIIIQNKNILLNKINKEEKASKIEQNFRCKRIIFYFIILSLNIFNWYYISCFSSIYKITQKHIFKDLLYSIPKNFIKCLIITFICFIIKIFDIRGGYSYIKKYITQIFNYYFAKFIIEEIIEFSIFLIIKKIKQQK